MVPEVAGFVVPVAGYQWADVEREVALSALGPGKPLRRHRYQEPHLQPVVRKWPQPERTTYPLRDAPTLCRAFAALPCGDSAADLATVRAFANTHGALGVGDLVRGEPVSSWREAISDMATALALLDTPSPATLKGWISWRTDRVQLDIVRQGRRRLDRIRLSDDPGRQLQAGYHLRPGDSGPAARAFAQRIINAGLQDHVDARLLLNPSRRAYELRVTPKNLLGVLWIQVAAVAEGSVRHRPCAAPGCGRWLALGIGSGRADRRTCSATCRKRLERQRARKPRRSA
ncbi:hypothetical protein KJ059_00770 [Myxococcota bacterium]|nr:hypothetical protein [Myxococcota bacterium]